MRFFGLVVVRALVLMCYLVETVLGNFLYAFCSFAVKLGVLQNRQYL